MSERLDANTRRITIAEAVLRIASRSGVDDATVRNVAAEAGVSAGMVQHYFTNRDEMLRFSCAYMVEKMQRDAAAKFASRPEPRDERDVLMAMFQEMLPTTLDRQTIVRIWMAFMQRAFVQPELGEILLNTFRQTHAAICSLLDAGKAAGRVKPDIDSDRTATRLFCLVDGFVSHVLLGQYSGDQAIAEIAAEVAALFVDDASSPGMADASITPFLPVGS